MGSAGKGGERCDVEWVGKIVTGSGSGRGYDVAVVGESSHRYCIAKAWFAVGCLLQSD